MPLHRAKPAHPTGRMGAGLLAGAVPHVLILLLMAVGIAGASGVERGYAGLYGFLEIYVVPLALLTAVVLLAVPRLRSWPLGIVISTVAGTLIVIVATLIVGNGDTWR